MSGHRASRRDKKGARRERPTRRQAEVTREVVRWYLNSFYGTRHDTGLPRMFCDRAMVGHFAVDRAALHRGDAGALFRLLVTMTMFQRRSDRQIMRVLQGVQLADVEEMTDAGALLKLSERGGCPHTVTTLTLKDRCDLTKDMKTGLGTCGAFPERPCHLKRHTVLLKRYGHFGKVPTSAALMVRDNDVPDLAGLYRRALADHSDPVVRAEALERGVRKAWRVSDKIAAMFLSAVTNPALSDGLAPWRVGVDTHRFVVVDSNVDLFLMEIGYRGRMTYAARRDFVRRLAAGVRLGELRDGLEDYNPRLVQQAMYMFKSKLNRQASSIDCGHIGQSECATCPLSLAGICSVRRDSKMS